MLKFLHKNPVKALFECLYFPHLGINAIGQALQKAKHFEPAIIQLQSAIGKEIADNYKEDILYTIDLYRNNQFGY